MNISNKERALRYRIITKTAWLLVLVIAGAALAQAPPIVTPEPAFTAGFTNPIMWSAPGTVPGITTAWEIWVDEAETGYPDWPDIPDTIGPSDISIFMIEDVAADWGDTYGSDYAYPVGIGDLGSADDPLTSGVRYCYKVRYRWLDDPDYGFSEWSETYCSRQDASPPSNSIDELPVWTNTSVCDVYYRTEDFVCGGIDSAVLYYKAEIDSPWIRYDIDFPAPAMGESYYEGSFAFDSDEAWGDGPYYFYVVGWDSLDNGFVPGVGTHYPLAWTRIDDEDPSSMLDTVGLPLYYNGWSGGINLNFSGNDTYSGVYTGYLDTDYETGHSHFIDSLFFYGEMSVDSFFVFTPTENGIYNLRSTLEDSAGNFENDAAWDWTINVDTGDPTFGGVEVYDTTTLPHRYDVPALSGWTNETEVEVVALSPDDPELNDYASGIEIVEAASNATFTSDLEAFDYGDTPYYWTTAPGPDGDRDAYLRLTDYANNVSSERQGIITLDTETPILFDPIEIRNRLTPDHSGDTTVSLTVDVIAEIDPAGGTVSGIFFSQNLSDLDAIDDDDWEPVDGDYEYTFTGFSDLDWMTLYAAVRDSAGNVSVEAFDSIRYITGSEFVEILSIKDIDGPDMTGRYTDTTLVEIKIRYGDGIDSILQWDGSAAIDDPDTFFWVPDPTGTDDTVTIIGKLDRSDGWHSITVKGASEYGGGIYTSPDVDSIELDIQYPRIGTFNVVDITTALEPGIPADIADTGWTNNQTVKASFLDPTDTGGDPAHPGTGIYYYRLSVESDPVLDTGGFPTPHSVNFDLPADEVPYEVWGEIQDSAGNWSSEAIPDDFGITLDTHVPVLDSIQLWDAEMTSMEYTDSALITVKAFGNDGTYENPYYIAIFEDLGDYPGEVRNIRTRYYSIGNSYTLTDVASSGLKTVYVAFMDRAGNISTVTESQIMYNKEIELELTLYDTDSDPMNTTCTNESNVTAILEIPASSTPAAEYILTESSGADPLPDDPRWEDYSEEVTFTLSEGEGEKVVYGWVLSVSNIVSPMAVDTIYLDQTAPEMDEGFEVWDTTSADAFPNVFQSALGWSNEAYVFAQVPSAYDEGCGVDSMRFSGGIDLDLWQAIDFNVDSMIPAVDLKFRTDSIPLMLDIESEGRKDVTAQLQDTAGNWGNTFDPNSMITIHGGYDTQAPDFDFLDVYDTTLTDNVTTPRPSTLPIHFTDDPAPGFLWKVCWQIDADMYCTVYDETWDTDSSEIFFAAFPAELAEMLEPNVHYDLNVVAIDSAGNPSEMKTADLLVIPDTIRFDFMVVDSNDTEDSEYCGELTVMTKIDIEDPPDEMRFGESETALGSWMTYSDEGYFTLGSSANGMKFVYAQVRYGIDMSQIEVDSIILDTQVPTVGNITAYDLESGDPNYTEEFTIGLQATGCSDNFEIGSIFIAEDPDFTLNAVRCDFDSVSLDGSTGWTTYDVSEEPYIPEEEEPSGSIGQDARRFWAQLMDRAENPAVQIKQPSIVIDLDNLTISNFPNPFNPDVEPTFIRVKGLETGETVEVNVYDNYGNLVWNESKSAEPNSKALDILWDGKNGQGDKIASGVYVAVVETGGEIFKRKIAVWKGGE